MTEQCPTCKRPFPTAPLTKRQREVYAYLYAYWSTHGIAPTHQEIADHFGLSSLATVNEHLLNLESKGYVESMGSGYSRNYVPAEAP